MTLQITPIAGTKWVRSNGVQLTNPFVGIPEITFNQEVMSEFADGTSQSLGGINSIGRDFTVPTTTFNLLNPADGTVTGTSTYQDLYVLLYSLYVAIVNNQV